MQELFIGIPHNSWHMVGIKKISNKQIKFIHWVDMSLSKYSNFVYKTPNSFIQVLSQIILSAFPKNNSYHFSIQEENLSLNLVLYFSGNSNFFS